MQENIVKELGLSPLWRKKSTLAETPPPPAAAVAEVPSKAVSKRNVVNQSPVQSPVADVSGGIRVAKMNWQQLRGAVEECQQCPLCPTRIKTVFGVGDRQATVMIIGEGPGEEEDQRGEPFVGRAGKLLDMMLHAIQLDRKRNVYISNMVKCRPPGNRNPTREEIEQCLPYLQRQIALVEPHLLVALGKVAAAHLLNTETSIAQLRQKVHDYNNIPLVVTYHPAYLLRSPQEKRKSWEDLKFIRRLLKEH
ncbi:MAG: uracil-DNA glycosylase [Proteobacteria bacterium]|nr:uracil-DNA glycosylase [Pseudomonadota bacterium]